MEPSAFLVMLAALAEQRATLLTAALACAFGAGWLACLGLGDFVRWIRRRRER